MSLQDDIERVQRLIQERMEAKRDAVRTILIQGFSNIIINSPVDEGTYRNNWVFSTRSPSEITYPASSSATDATRRLLDKMPDKLKHGRYFYQNNMPYADFLETRSLDHKGEVRKEIVRIKAAIRNV